MPAAPATRPDAVVGVDIGTTSTKVVAFTPGAELVASTARGYPLHAARPGRAEQDPDEVLAAALEATAAAVEETRRAGHGIAALSLSGALHGLLALDEHDRPLTPFITWGDARAGAQAKRLRTEDRALALHKRTGTPVHPMSPLVKLRWFAEHEPGIAAAARRWVGSKEPLLHALTGEWAVDHGLASAMGMFDLEREDWDPEALEYAGVGPERLPRLVPTTTVLPLSEAGARRVGLPAGCPVVAGSSDGALANLGLGAIREGTAACSIGTSGALRVASERPRVDDQGRVFCYVLAPGHWVVGGAINNGGSVLDWVEEALAPEAAAAAGDGAARALLDLAAEAAPGSDALLFVPHLLGERAPRWVDGARAAFVGLTRAHKRPELVRATVEGVCLQLALVLGSLRDAGIDVREIRATGGFSRSPLWRRILAGVLGMPIGFAASPEGTGLGAALLGMYATEIIDDLGRAADIVPVDRVEEPDAAEAEVYARLVPLYERAVDAVAEVSAALSDVHEQLPPPPRHVPERPDSGG